MSLLGMSEQDQINMIIRDCGLQFELIQALQERVSKLEMINADWNELGEEVLDGTARLLVEEK